MRGRLSKVQHPGGSSTYSSPRPNNHPGVKHLVLADVHANLPALEAVLDRETDWDEVLFLGDAVGYGPHPDEVLDLLSTLAGTFVMGNHDRKILDSPTGEPDTPAQAVDQWTRERLSPANRQFLEGFVDERHMDTPDGILRLHHGDFPCVEADADWDGRGWPDTSPAVYGDLAARYDEPTVLFGHSHVQFELEADGTHFVNPGSVGQHRLGQIAACYAVLEDGEFRLDAVEYDAGPTAEAMDALPLDGEYVEGRKRVYEEGVLPHPMR